MTISMITEAGCATLQGHPASLSAPPHLGDAGGGIHQRRGRGLGGLLNNNTAVCVTKPCRPDLSFLDPRAEISLGQSFTLHQRAGFHCLSDRPQTWKLHSNQHFSGWVGVWGGGGSQHHCMSHPKVGDRVPTPPLSASGTDRHSSGSSVPFISSSGHVVPLAPPTQHLRLLDCGCARTQTRTLKMLLLWLRVVTLLHHIFKIQ